jgi:MerR family transcriptional regulator, copper efflux regulator
MMLISEFVRATGLSKDTVRFYVRLGLLTPETNGKGGRNPYQVFTQDHVRAVNYIRLGQSLGMSLKEIAAINREYMRDGGISQERSIEIMSRQLVRLEQKAAETGAMVSYLRAKLAWLRSSAEGPEPNITDYIPGTPTHACVDDPQSLAEPAEVA